VDASWVIMVTGEATVIEIGTKMIAGAGESIQGVVQQETMAIGFLAEENGTAAMGELLHGGSSGAAVARMSVIATVHPEVKGMSHGTEVTDGAENTMGHLEIVVMVRDTAAGVEMFDTGALQMAVRPGMYEGKCIAAAAGNGTVEVRSGHRRWKMA